MDKRLTVPKWVLINRPKIPQNLSAQIVCPSPKVWDFDEKRLHWASVVRDCVVRQSSDCKTSVGFFIPSAAFETENTDRRTLTLAGI